MEGSLQLSWTARSSLVGVSAPFRFSYAAARRERSSAHGNSAYKIASLRFRHIQAIRGDSRGISTVKQCCANTSSN